MGQRQVTRKQVMSTKPHIVIYLDRMVNIEHVNRQTKHKHIKEWKAAMHGPYLVADIQ